MPGSRLVGGGSCALTQGSPTPSIFCVLMFCHAPHCPWATAPRPRLASSQHFIHSQ